jgi:hypothetical protein
MPLYNPSSSGSSTLSVSTKTTTATLSNSDDVVLIDATGGAFTLTLHDPTTATRKIYRLKKTDSSVNYVTLGGYNLNGASRKMCTLNEELEIYPDGTNWQVINHFTEYTTSVTPTGSWSTNTTYTGRISRMPNGYLLYNFRVATSGAPTAAALTVNMPTGYVIDTARFPAGSAGNTPIGLGVANDASVNPFDATAAVNSTTSILTYARSVSGSLITYSTVTNAAPFTFTTSDYVELHVTVPIVDWW